jgi:hypothetical protein
VNSFSEAAPATRFQRGVVGFERSPPEEQVVVREVDMSKAKDDIRPEYKRGELGRGVRGKYFARASRGTNLVVLEDKVAKAFPSSEAVNEALLGLLNLTEQTSRITGRSIVRARARR